MSAPKTGPAVAMALAALGAVGCVAGVFVDVDTLLSSWLFAWGTVTTLCLAMLFLVLLHHVTDSGWSTVFRRWAEHFASAIPLLAVLGLPILIGMARTYPWADGSFGHHGSKAVWLDPTFFAIRVVLYLAAWSAIAHFMVAPSVRQDQSGDAQESFKLRRRSAPLLVAFGLTFGFGAMDLFMTLDPHWYSTIYGIYVFAQSVVAALALLILLALFVRRHDATHVPTSRLGDLGTLAFAMSSFWAYIAFSQYFLIWYGNLPEETVWFLARFRGGWAVVSVLLPIFLWVLPFVGWMPFQAKRARRSLMPIGALILVGHLIGMYWLIVPSAAAKCQPPPGRLWLDAAALLLIGGATAAWISRRFATHGLRPAKDPRLSEAVGTAEGSHA